MVENLRYVEASMHPGQVQSPSPGCINQGLYMPETEKRDIFPYQAGNRTEQQFFIYDKGSSTSPETVWRYLPGVKKSMVYQSVLCGYLDNTISGSIQLHGFKGFSVPCR